MVDFQSKKPTRDRERVIINRRFYQENREILSVYASNNRA